MRIKILLAFFLLSVSINAYCQDEAGETYSTASRDAVEGKADFAFLNFKAIADLYPDSKYYPQALFAIGEYYFQNNDYSQARVFFNKVLECKLPFQMKVFSLAYLLDISRRVSDDPAAKNISMEIIRLNPVSLVFKDSKKYSYKSPMNKKYSALYFIDRIEIQVDKKEFEKIPLQ